VQKQLTKIGSSLGIIIDKPILDLLRITVNTPLEVTTDGDRLILRPLRFVDNDATGGSPSGTAGASRSWPSRRGDRRRDRAAATSTIPLKVPLLQTLLINHHLRISCTSRQDRQVCQNRSRAD